MQLMLEHQVIGIFPNLVILGAELLHGFLMFLIPRLANMQGTVDRFLDHPPHIGCFMGCGLGHGVVHCL